MYDDYTYNIDQSAEDREYVATTITPVILRGETISLRHPARSDPHPRHPARSVPHPRHPARSVSVVAGSDSVTLPMWWWMLPTSRSMTQYGVAVDARRTNAQHDRGWCG